MAEYGPHCHLGQAGGQHVSVTDKGKMLLLDNGFVKLTLSKPGGAVLAVSYAGISNLLDAKERETGRGYWDCNWTLEGKGIFTGFLGTECHLITHDADRVEVSFVMRYCAGDSNSIPLIVDKRFVVLRGSHGFYTYAIYETPPGCDWPEFTLNQTRVVFKLDPNRFHYMAIADDRQCFMPSKHDFAPDKIEKTAIAEANILINPQNPSLRGQLDDKYHHAMDNKDCRVHGWVSEDKVGFWIVNASDEYLSGGPMKQNLTSHTGPISLKVFHGGHMAPPGIEMTFQKGEQWRKTYGPFFVYLNYAPPHVPHTTLWNDAKARMLAETAAWPPPWPASRDFLKAEERGTVKGALRVRDPYVPPGKFSATYAFVGLSAPGEKGAWQTETKGYQFWAQADYGGAFTIGNVRPGVYDVYGWVPGVMGDCKREGGPITVGPKQTLDLGELWHCAPRDGPTVWEIGVPDRTASGFIPDPDPKYVDRTYFRHPTQSFRQYGLWERYSAAFPTNDLVYTVGVSDWRTDWFFIHGVRMDGKGGWLPTTWEIKFELPSVVQSGMYKLRVVFAQYNYAAVQVRVNDRTARHPIEESKVVGKDNAIARTSNHGIYAEWVVNISPALLKDGQNSIFLTQRVARAPYSGVMYDYIRFEAPTSLQHTEL